MEPTSVDLEKAIAPSLAYLESDEAIRSIERDPYWPKWDSPWWHMLVLFELGYVNIFQHRDVVASPRGCMS